MNCICFIGTHQTVPLKIIKENHSNIQTSRSYIHKRGNTEYPSLTRHLVAEVFLYTCRDLFHQCAYIFIYFSILSEESQWALLCSYMKHSSLDKEHLVCSNMYKLDIVSPEPLLHMYTHQLLRVSECSCCIWFRWKVPSTFLCTSTLNFSSLLPLLSLSSISNLAQSSRTWRSQKKQSEKHERQTI